MIAFCNSMNFNTPIYMLSPRKWLITRDAPRSRDCTARFVDVGVHVAATLARAHVFAFAFAFFPSLALGGGFFAASRVSYHYVTAIERVAHKIHIIALRASKLKPSRTIPLQLGCAPRNKRNRRYQSESADSREDAELGEERVGGTSCPTQVETCSHSSQCRHY